MSTAKGRPVLHFHIGAGKVFPELVGTAHSYLKQCGRSKAIKYISDRDFTDNLFNALRSDDIIAAKEYANHLTEKADIVICGRPSFLRSTNIQTLSTLPPDAPEKLGRLQAIFSGYRIVLHFLVEDHVQFLCRHYRRVRTTSAQDLIPSWSPLLTEIGKHLHEGNKTLLWDVRDRQKTLMEFSSFVCAERLTKKPVLQQADIDADELRQVLTQLVDQGVDFELLDDLYDQDLADLEDFLPTLPGKYDPHSRG